MADRAKALLVDDRKDNLLALEAILQGLPVTAVAVESGEAAEPDGQMIKREPGC